MIQKVFVLKKHFLRHVSFLFFCPVFLVPSQVPAQQLHQQVEAALLAAVSAPAFAVLARAQHLLPHLK